MSRILVIDDAPSILKLIEIILTEAGYEVVCCADGRCAMARLRREPFDLLITDIYMPDEDGLEIIGEGRRICPTIPIVAMSGITGKRNMLNVARHLGACGTVLKPFSKADLLDAVVAAGQHASPACAGRKDGAGESNQPCCAG